MRVPKWVGIVMVCAAGVGTAWSQTTEPSPTAPTTEPAQTPEPPKPAGPARIQAGVIAGHILTKVAPVYPAEARKAHVGGTVVMHAIIGKDGKIDSLTYISGPDMLRDAAMDAVRQWTYEPYMLNGEPTEVDTTIQVNFNLNGMGPSPQGWKSGEASPPGTIRISGGVLAGSIASKVNPVYPREAREAHVSGTVVLHVLVGKDGSMKRVEVISGPEMLQAAALDAVKQWVYKPYLLNGEPVVVDSIVLVNFNLTNQTTARPSY